jgi:hypothetical protein
MSIGDQEWDVGEYGVITVKLPLYKFKIYIRY